MGVAGLWSIVQPCARPTKLETLHRKRLAVDASIWIYQFLKAVRDKEGNALRNSHVVGFFRRICKLLFFGIKPVFVFDGGAPALKRSVIRARKQRREGRRDDAARTAGKLLAVQMQRRAEEEEMRRKEEARHPVVEEEAIVPESEMVYVDELQMTQQERQQNRKFRKKDAYHLPDLDVSMNEMGGPNDMRIMSLEELQAYARQFEAGEDINVYDFSKIDYESPFFTSLPASDRYNILNAARLRSRLRMGHSKEQLDTMFPDRMAFSKFQIERVTERNELTQRLMHINGGDDAAYSGQGRVAGEKGREYVLVKNDGVEGGWALGVVSNEGTTVNKAIDLDKPEPIAKQESESEEDFEDVPVEGLNRLPKQNRAVAVPSSDLSRKRKAFYESRKSAMRKKPKMSVPDDPESLFVAEQTSSPEPDVDEEDELFAGSGHDSADEDLDRAIAMSLQKENGETDEQDDSSYPDEDRPADAPPFYHQAPAPTLDAVPRGSGRAIANLFNKRAHAVAPDSREVTSFGVPAPRSDDGGSDDDEEALDLQAALAESRKGRRERTPEGPGPRYQNTLPHAASPVRTRKPDPVEKVAKQSGFTGPLPFEKLDLGTSLLGAKKMQARTEEAKGGFVRPGEDIDVEKKSAEPLPPWFEGSLANGIVAQKGLEAEDRERAREFGRQFQFEKKGRGVLKRWETREVIDLEGEEEDGRGGEVIEIDGDDEVRLEGRGESPTLVMDGMELLTSATSSPRPAESQSDAESKAETMDDAAEELRAEPQVPSPAEVNAQVIAAKTAAHAPFEMMDSDEEEAGDTPSSILRKSPTSAKTADAIIDNPPMSSDLAAEPEAHPTMVSDDKADDQEIEWSDSDGEGNKTAQAADQAASRVNGTTTRLVALNDVHAANRSPSADFEDVNMEENTAPAPARSPSADFEDVDMATPGKQNKPPSQQQSSRAIPALEPQDTLPDLEEDNYDSFSDPEDVEILRGLAAEAEEHARFASQLNNKPATTQQNIADYEAELRQLRNQQKKDRRDADEVTHVMITECQALLRLFGLPYITAPMEAEAQCAELVRLGLVDGIVTDDSDCFLFGGTRIYKNFFNQGKFVECYLSSDLEKEFALTRDRLVSIAQLLGSDYTEGLPGIGPVTALELIGEFDTLSHFASWWAAVQSPHPPEKSSDSPLLRKFRKAQGQKLFLPSSFPDPRVASAYSDPDVDSSSQSFQWGVPDLDALRDFLMATIGWTQERTDEVLVPVIRDMNNRAEEGVQSNLTKYFSGAVGVGAAGGKGKEGFAPRKRAQEGKSARMGGALRRMAERAQSRGEGEGAIVTEGTDVNTGEAAAADKTKTTSARKRKSANGSRAAADHDADMGDESDGSNFASSDKSKERKSTTKTKAVPKPRGKRRAKTASPHDEDDSDE
ncbi:DNA repair protein rad2 [Oleoguttula sp. CCFEE 5521]